jgi:hypothetical protein
MRSYGGAMQTKHLLKEIIDDLNVVKIKKDELAREIGCESEWEKMLIAVKHIKQENYELLRSIKECQIDTLRPPLDGQIMTGHKSRIKNTSELNIIKEKLKEKAIKKSYELYSSDCEERKSAEGRIYHQEIMRFFHRHAK